MTSCISMQPRRTRDQFDLYDAMVRADSIVGRTRLVLDAPLHAVATVDLAQV